MRPFNLPLSLGLALAPIAVCTAGPIEIVPTTGAFSATYGTASQTSPSVPWSDLGFQATASVTSGTLSATLGGSTQYQLTSSVSGAQTFTPGVTQIDLGYAPAWTGSMSTAANGTLGINFVYGIGPFTASTPVLTDSMTTGVSGLALSGALNSGSGLSDSTTTPGLGIGGGLGVQMQAFCPLCVTVASASVGYHVGSQVTQNLSVNPNVTYGDLLWFTNDATSASTTPITVVGGVGSVANTFPLSLAVLGLMNGSNSVDMNILPFAALSLGVGNEAIVSIPASISYSYDVFGVSGSGSDSGNLYSLSTGLQGLTATGTWYAPDAYSIEIDASCNFNAVCNYQTDGTNPLLLTNLGIPANLPLGSTAPLPPTGIGGSGFPMLGPLVPGDTGCVPGVRCQAPCDPATGSDCIDRVTLTGNNVPEPDAIWLLMTGVLLLAVSRRGRCSRAPL